MSRGKGGKGQCKGGPGTPLWRGPNLLSWALYRGAMPHLKNPDFLYNWQRLTAVAYTIHNTR